jgi:hypothetical protein
MGKATKGKKRQRKLAAALVLGAMGAVAAQPALAQDLQQISADERIEFDIPAQPLSSALSEFVHRLRKRLSQQCELRARLRPPFRPIAI